MQPGNIRFCMEKGCMYFYTDLLTRADLLGGSLVRKRAVNGESGWFKSRPYMKPVVFVSLCRVCSLTYWQPNVEHIDRLATAELPN
jgi:hypothetical protein